MICSVTQNKTDREDWIQQLSDVVTDSAELLQLLDLSDQKELLLAPNAQRLFAVRVPRHFIRRMEMSNPNDPLLKQVFALKEELIEVTGYSKNPLNEQPCLVPGLLHKYHNRALLLVKTGCAINCRYCFRRHFPYNENQGNKANWLKAIEYISQHPELDEIIFSGGDPLMAKDNQLNWLINQLENIPHIQRLRIHSRLVSVIPARVTSVLCQILAHSRLQILLVTHINHANEIDASVIGAMAKLKQAQVTLLNQSVLLRGVNDSTNSLANLSNALFNAGILPYYLHLLDKVQGAAHFMVSDQQARQLLLELMTRVSGYLVPRLVRELGGKLSKTWLDLGSIEGSS